MAQVLKDEVKQSIFDSAKEEFLIRGYEAATMRSIAKRANMTVGNLYRYFDSKEEINRQIVEPTLNKINDIVKDVTQNSISLETRVFDVRFDTSKFETILDDMVRRVVRVFVENKTEFNIISINSSLNNDFVHWFAKQIKDMLTVSFNNEKYAIDIDVLSNSFAIAFHYGFIEIFKHQDIDEESLIRIARTYFRSYLYLHDGSIVKNIIDGE